VDAIRFAVLGLGTGSLYALVGLGVVLVFRSSGVLNLSAGSTGAVAAWFFYSLRDVHGIPAPVALVLALGLGGAIGAGVQVLAMSRLHQSSAITRLIATLAVFTLLNGIAILIWGADAALVVSPLPTGVVSLPGNVSISLDRLLLIVLAVVVAAVLKIVYSRTSFGLATTAVAENRRATASLGWSTRRIELVNWFVAGVLSALAAVLLAPIASLQVATLSLLVVPALAAALVGRFSSFALTVLGAMALGVVQSELARYVTAPGVGDSVPFLVIIVVIVLGGRSLPSRADLPSRLPAPGLGRIDVRWLLVGAAVLLALVLVLPPVWVATLTTLFIVAVLVMSVVVVTGYAGQVSLSQWALAGMGAWFAAEMVATFGWSFWAAAAGGMLATVPVGLVVALPAMRTRGVDLAVATLGLALVLTSVVLQNGALTGGLDGIEVGSPRLFGVDIGPTRHPTRYAVLTLVVFLVVSVLVANLRRGRAGRRLIAVRSSERAAASLGVGVYTAKLYAFAVGAAVAGAAGILAAFRTEIVVFTQFDVFGSLNALMYAVVGGLGWVSGALLGAGLAPGTPGGKVVESFGDVNAYLPIIGGTAVLLILVRSPDGLAALHAAAFARTRAALASAPGWAGAATAATPHPRTSPPPPAPQAPARPRQHGAGRLEVRDLTVRYGGVTALDGAGLRVEPGTVVGLIGPNGAGKTTLLDAVTGFTSPAAGSVALDGQDITRWTPGRRARAGIGRSFQGVELFDELTVLDNLLVAADDQSPLRYLLDPLRPGTDRIGPATRRVIDDLELGGVLAAMPAELPSGTARLVGVARALVAEPAVLFLDEPAAGLDSRETAELGALIRRIATQWGIGVVLVEHDVPLVLGICDHVVVLDFGRCIATGTPEEIRRDPHVLTAYLGTDHDTAAAALP
jgi:ABC-type branched-subunit amino acid transport system ATPase component/branched-subunit amino acid ABC-type transport system permease component